MSERPILMRGPLVVATLEDRKWMTRRVVKNPYTPAIHQSDVAPLVRDCPYGGVDDRLWVRESWARVPTTAYRASTGVQQTVNPSDPDEAAIYRAGWDRSDPGVGWKPSIHMPRWASRLALEITTVRVERIQDISLDDMRAEGVRPDQEASLLWRETLRENFISLWDSINAKRGYGWASNPWVWVIGYRRIV
jgi:hypothetical protein